ncbi:putative ribonuclease [Podospora australis]|uniref:Ribonuclease H2 subunit B n=1 Tax=Podospora australis TaxID=1536484 RepID=A0AAN7AME6_9PEZI|nr:putative ribonuclease [Podospora australis]
MARTRSKGAASDKTTTAKSKSPSKTTTSTYTLPSESTNPPKLFVLPKNASPSARIVTLQHPRHAKPTRYLVCPETGAFHEFTKIAPPSKSASPRSWLLSSESEQTTLQSPNLYVATPFDPLFLLLPALLASTPGEKRMFLSSEDHFDRIPNIDRHFSETLTWPGVQSLLETRMFAVCDIVKAGDESMFRVNEDKLFAEVLSKAKKLAAQLPKSMEEKFVRKALEAPVMGIQSQAAGAVSSPAVETPTPTEGDSPGTESQSTLAIVESQTSEASTAATSIAGEDTTITTPQAAMTASDEILNLQRLKIAFGFICASYISPKTAESLKQKLEETENFKPLEEYVTKLAKLRQEAAASRANDFSGGKRGRDEEDDERAEKKRKMEAEEKIKKANQSRGVKQLAKVNTSGMMKLSAFFKKKT